MDSKQREDFVDDINDEYEEVREDHYDGLKVRKTYFPFNCSLLSNVPLQRRQPNAVVGPSLRNHR